MIENYHFGNIEVNGEKYDKDIEVWPQKVLKWWREEGHNVIIKDIERAVSQGPEIVVIGTGASGMMNISEEAINHLKTSNIIVEIRETTEAVKKYNQLEKEGKKVVGLFHLTC